MDKDGTSLIWTAQHVSRHSGTLVALEMQRCASIYFMSKNLVSCPGQNKKKAPLPFTFHLTMMTVRRSKK
jgi:hypothetical protein